MGFADLLATAQASVSNVEYNERYDGTRQLTQIGVSIPPRVRSLEMVVNWPRLVVDTMAEALAVDGFEGADMPDEHIEAVWRVWQSTNMKSRSHLAHVEAMTQGAAYALVGVTEQGSVKTDVLPKDGIAVVYGPDGQPSEAVVSFEADTEQGTRVKRAAYYLPDSIEVFQEAYGTWVSVSKQRGCGLVPIIPIVNKTRLGDMVGRSDMDLVIPYGDAASRSFTLLQLATELLSLPQRYIIGGDWSKFKKGNGEQPTAEEIYLGTLMVSPDKNSKYGQLEGARLDQVIAVLKHCAEMVSAMTGLPVSMLGVTTNNPSSAEAMRAAKDRMISRGEFKQDVFGDSWEQWARVVLAILGMSLEGSETLNAVWRDVATPSNSAKSAYLLQAHAQGVISARTARDGLPLTPEQRARENKTIDESEALGLAGRQLVEA
ncbi:phage portal protein [Mobiluncus mulieris]|uniref:Phage portal protein n=1 Tax=Mobiluncus mulieris TaxID=2052 RepID=A0A7Y0Y3H2_9ACTO|nr:phage portal protein [Mobiluncus mulieris]NMW64426.1 phage portal protein [Mobiluncus mulieris]